MNRVIGARWSVLDSVWRLMKIRGALFAILVAAICFFITMLTMALASCSSDTNASIPSQVPAEPVITQAAATGTADGSALRPFGFGRTALGGVDLTVSVPKVFKPSAEASGLAAGDVAVVVTVTAVNHTTRALDNESDMYLTATADDVPASQIADTGLTGTAKVLPGHRLTWRVAFSVPANATILNVDAAVHPMGDANVVDTYFSGGIK